MTKISKSPSRYTFQRDMFIDRQLHSKNMDSIETQQQLEYYNSLIPDREKKEQDVEWQKNNLEYDLRTNDYMLAKVRASESYAQNLYAALCNNDFIKNDVWPLLQDDTWGCSWRYAGGIIADMREEGDYIDWYCSGIGKYKDINNVGEGIVTDEIKDDLFKLGWLVKEQNYGLE